MSRGRTELHEVEGVLAEHIRASLLKLLVHAQGGATNVQVEDGLRFLIDQLDGFELAQNISTRQEALILEPVNIAELSDQVLHKLSGSLVGKSLKVKTSSLQKSPVLAHRSSLARSLESMIHVAVDTTGGGKLGVLEINTIKQNGGLRLGVYSETFIFKASDFRRVRENRLKSRRPSASLSASATAHLYIADSLLGAMGATFRTSIHGRKRGVATVLPFSSQLPLLPL